MMTFKVCPRCDFEWHDEDGEVCPVCRKGKISALEKREKEEASMGGFFIAAEKSSKTKRCLQALGFVTLVYLLAQYVFK